MAKKNNNDAVILELRRQIDEKKKALRGIDKPNYKTNLSYPSFLQGERINLNVVSLDVLKLVLAEVNSLRLSALDQGIDISLHGFTPDEWVADLHTKILIKSKTSEEARLRALEDKLTDLLSPEKKTELVINELKDLI